MSAIDQAVDLNLRDLIQAEHRSNPTPWFEWVYSQLDLSPHTRVLDLGSGTASVWKHADRCLPEGIQIVLLDTSGDMLRYARSSLHANRYIFPLVNAKAGQLPFADASFDLVFAGGVLDLVPDLDRTIHEVARVLRRGAASAHLVVTTSGYAHLSEMKEIANLFTPGANLGGAPGRFSLENGCSHLQPPFEACRRSDYLDTLIFHQPGPLLVYLLSEPDIRSRLQPGRLQDLEQIVRRWLGDVGEIQVTCHKGLLSCRVPA